MSSFKYIAFEGIDGAGKTTQARLFCDMLQKNGEPVFATREPGGLINELRGIVLKKEIPPKARMFLFLADRAASIKQLKRELEHKHVVSDRCFFSTIAYQAFGYGIDVDFVEEASLFSAERMIPDLTFIIDIGIDTMMRRLSGKSADAIESKGENFFERVREGYRYIANNYSNVYVINGERGKKEIFREIEEIWKSESSMYML